jgi:hypothetical protein
VRIDSQRTGRFLVAAGAACLGLLAWTGTATADNYRYQIVPADHAAATQAVLKRSDLMVATGWTGGLTKPDRSGNTITCHGRKPKLSDIVVTGDAQSVLSYKGGGGIVTSSSVYRTVKMLDTSWGREVAAVDLACVRAEFASKLGATVQLVSVQRLAFPQIGSHTAAFRARLRYENGLPGLFDIVMFARGRTGCTLAMGGVIDSPQAPSQYLAAERYLASILASRMAVT